MKNIRRNHYTYRVIRDIENRPNDVFTAMEFCLNCNSYAENKCEKHKTPPPTDFTSGPFADFGTPLWYEAWIKDGGFHFSIDSFQIFINNQSC